MIKVWDSYEGYFECIATVGTITEAAKVFYERYLDTDGECALTADLNNDDITERVWEAVDLNNDLVNF